MTQTITPVIKKTRVKTEQYEVCPHCQKEIGEKEIYIDPENFCYHRPCRDKGPIEQIKPCKIVWDKNGIRCAQDNRMTKTAASTRVYDFFYRFLAGMPLEVAMQSYEWPQVKQLLDVMGKGMSPEELQKRVERDSLPQAYRNEWDKNHSVKTAQAEERHLNEFFRITVPLSNRDECDMFSRVVNQGIDTHLEGFVRSTFGHGSGDFDEPRLILNFHVSELPILVRRLRELETESAESWADDIEESPEFVEAMTHPKNDPPPTGVKPSPVTIPDITNEEFKELFPENDDMIFSGAKPTIVKLAGGKYGLKISRSDLIKILERRK